MFINPKTGTRLTEFKRSFATALKKAKIRDFRFHDLRHTFTSQLIMKGADLKTVQELLGHRTLAMTLSIPTYHRLTKRKL
ncbi:tyrosine-type recombinase/integrase [Thermodesulfovibrio yellowstonii]|uniref:tyrosine-type recombinase/integrase n=1 Tax=Thermodesulfovibrio yellowstonii TaxID=28262 RepID=UPI0009FDE0CC